MNMRSPFVLLTALGAVLGGLEACSGGSGSSGSALATCITTYSGQSDSCTVGAICGGTTYRADCEALADGGACVCDVIDAGSSKAVPFQAGVCAPLGSNGDPTPNASAANSACGWNL
ncbi:MAG TPA: hypothetical protein VIF09_13210 [Polyangiaceae bacterium]|jgi:hypothetical protein